MKTFSTNGFFVTFSFAFCKSQNQKMRRSGVESDKLTSTARVEELKRKRNDKDGGHRRLKKYKEKQMELTELRYI